MTTEYLTNDTDLKAVADAIRTKAGSTAALAFPDGFVSAVNGIQTGGGGGAGFSVTFPATATNWNTITFGMIVQADGNRIYIKDYSGLAGKTIPNAVEIRCKNYNNLLKMSIQTGRILTIWMYPSPSTAVTIDGGVTPTYTTTGDSSDCSWVFLEDTVISAIEMYNEN